MAKVAPVKGEIKETKADMEKELQVISAEEVGEVGEVLATAAPTEQAQTSVPPTARIGVKGARIPKNVAFPVQGKVNKYGFLHFSKNLRHTLGFPTFKDVPVLFNMEGGRLYIDIQLPEEE